MKEEKQQQEHQRRAAQSRRIPPVPLIAARSDRLHPPLLLFVPPGLIEQRVTDSPRGCCPISGRPAPVFDRRKKGLCESCQLTAWRNRPRPPSPVPPASGSHTPDKPKSASEHRKSSKPIMEKRRRARINESLGQLKTLILDALKKDSSRHSKLEKADILEMTVKHLRNLQRAQMTAAMSTDAAVLSKYRAGFNECVNEVTHFLSTCEGVSTEVRSRLLGHLSACLAQVIAASGYSHPAHAAQQAHVAAQQPLHAQLPASAKLGGPSEAASPKVFGGFQLVPATDGQFAFLVPSPAAFGSATAPVIPLYANAGLPLAVSAGPVHASAAPTAASPVQGMTCFNGAARTASPVGVSAGPESSEPVWRPW
ncbi:hypothetical protein SRHO_G00150280 [Serrasalmus rhombeus]